MVEFRVEFGLLVKDVFSWEYEDIEVIESSFMVATVVGGVGDGVRALDSRGIFGEILKKVG